MVAVLGENEVMAVGVEVNDMIFRGRCGVVGWKFGSVSGTVVGRGVVLYCYIILATC